MDKRLETCIPEGMEGYVRKKLLMGNEEIKATVMKYIDRKFNPEELRRRFTTGKFAYMEIPLAVEYYPELADLHEELIKKFVEYRGKVMNVLSGPFHGDLS